MYRDAREVKLGEPDHPVRERGVWAEASPEVLWLRGTVPAGMRCAVVGARAASAAGLVAARQLSMALAAADVTVVSGGAVGIDGAAHRGALDAGGRTVVVLGTGIDVDYPVRHGPLFDEIVAAGGAVLTPFSPGQRPARWTFPRRNALIASLASTVVVVEADAGSGSLYTAEWARRLGRRLLVLVGSAGCDGLAAEGAEAAIDLERLLEMALTPVAAGPGSTAVRTTSNGALRRAPVDRALPLWSASASPGSPRNTTIKSLPDDPRARRLYEALDGTPRDLGEVAVRAGVSAGEALALAIDLELGGLAARAAGGRYLRLS